MKNLKTIATSGIVALATAGVAFAAAIIGPPSVAITDAPESVKVGSLFTIAGFVQGTSPESVMDVTVSATPSNGHGQVQSSSFVVVGSEPEPFEVPFRASGLSGGWLDITVTATVTGPEGETTISDSRTVRVTRGNGR
ncbi:MAG: hypothetical protein L0216_16900 [Planctomycetales bacterium]|nr:hypothetical protein [Planctomycetales bacterium]